MEKQVRGGYVAPQLEVVEVMVETGFAGSIWVEDGTGGGTGSIITPPVD